MRASSSSDKSLTFRPLSQYSPALGVSRQPTRFMSVDFPDPEGPITATYSFLRICRLTPRSARTTSPPMSRSEEHTSELQSQSNLVCRLLLEKKKKQRFTHCHTVNKDSA